jgi:hypothetical protein
MHSYVEGIVRGYRNALLTSQNYSNLTQCENIDGMERTSDIQHHLTSFRCQAATLASLWRLPQLVASKSIDVCARR